MLPMYMCFYDKVIKPAKVLVRSWGGYHCHLTNTFQKNRQKRTKLLLVPSSWKNKDYKKHPQDLPVQKKV